MPTPTLLPTQPLARPETEAYLPQDLLVKFRKMKGWTQQELAELVNLSSNRIVRKWEAGESLPKAQTLKLLIELFVKHQLFAQDQIEQEARRFWLAVKEAADKTSNKGKPYPQFDENWFSQILQSIKIASVDVANSSEPPEITTAFNEPNLLNHSSMPNPKSLLQPLLATKLFIPTLRSNLVERQQLVELVQKGLRGKLTLISAPVGFGKTTLVSTWYFSQKSANNNAQKVAWISLDENDNDPVRFLRYIVLVLQRVGFEIDTNILEQLYLLNPLPLENILTILINQLNAFLLASADKSQAVELVLILDDYHLIENETVHQILSFLLEHTPEQLHLLITSRIDPPIPLHRLRVRGQLVEIRASNLRFSFEEIREFMANFANFSLTEPQLDKLAQTTEGWIASLQLAALAMQAQPDPTKFINSFSGNNYLVLDYLVKEVLDHQAEKVRTFLLASAYLECFNASLVSAVTGTEWSNADLLELQQANLFLISLDDAGEWYRYHRLFADVLRHQLKIQQPNLLPKLQLRASLWFEQNDLLYEAIIYALDAQAYDQASRLIANFYGEPLSRSDFDLLGRRLSQIPITNVIKYPELCFNAVVFAFQHRNFGRREEQLVEGLTNFVSTENRIEWTGKLFVLRMMVARYQNNIEEFIFNSEQALLHLPTNNLYERSRINISLAAVYLNQGEITKTLNLLLPLQKMYIANGNLETELSSLFVLGEIYTWQGQLKQAAKLFTQVIQEAEGTWVNPVLIYLRLAHNYWEWNEQSQAYEYLKRVEEFMETGGWKMGQFVYSNLWSDNNNLALFTEQPTGFAVNTNLGNQLENDDDTFVKQQVEGLRWRLQVEIPPQSLEEIEAVEISFDSSTILNNSVLTYQQEPQYLKLARILVKQRKFAEAFALLQDLKQVASVQGRQHSVIKILVLQTVALAASNSTAKAEKILEEVLTLAEPGGYIQSFAQEGEVLAKILRAKKFQTGKLTAYVKQLLAAFDTRSDLPKVKQSQSSQVAVVAPNQAFDTNLVESLTYRELTILRMMSKGASNQEIADELVLAIGTVKKHISNIFDKLEVTNRTQAFVRAQELGLV